MYVLYKNNLDEYNLHVGKLLTSLDKIETGINYIDVIPEGRLASGEYDWKNRHICDICLKDVVALSDNVKLFEEKFPEEFL